MRGSLCAARETFFANLLARSKNANALTLPTSKSSNDGMSCVILSWCALVMVLICSGRCELVDVNFRA